jgi:nitroreductase
MNPTDPIIDELHAIREAISAASEDDLQKIAEAARARQNSGNREVVTLPPKRTVENQAS